MGRFCILNQFCSMVYFHCGTTKAIQVVNAQFFIVKFVFSFDFSLRSKVIIIVIQFMFLGMNIFWARLRLILAQAKEPGVFVTLIL